MAASNFIPCAADGCAKRRRKGVYCKHHHTCWRLCGDPLKEPPRISDHICIVEACGRPVEKRDLCGKHYQAFWKYGRADAVDAKRSTIKIYTQCTVAGCKRRVRSRICQYCETHYYRIRRNGTLELKPRKPPKPEKPQRFCFTCKTPFPLSARIDKRYCCWQCRRQANGRGANLDLLGERDGWRCHICGGKVRRKDATQSICIRLRVSVSGVCRVSSGMSEIHR
jgi:hypothetical protein